MTNTIVKQPAVVVKVRSCIYCLHWLPPVFNQKHTYVNLQHSTLGKLARAPVAWHATILNSKSKIVCSGVLTGTKYVLTTASCAKRTSKNGHVRFGYFKTTVKWHEEIGIKSIRKSNLNDIVIIELARRIVPSFYVYPIRARRFISLRRPTFVTAWGTHPSLRISRVALPAPTSCKNAFYSFNVFKDVCTQPTGVPVGPRKNGSPLVQVYGRQVYLVGLLTDVTKEFGKYVKITRLRYQSGW